MLHQIGDQRGNALAVAVPQHFSELSRQIFLPQHTGTNAVVNVMLHIGNFITEANDLPLQSGRALLRRTIAAVVEYAVQHLPGKIQSWPSLVPFNALQHPHTVNVVPEPAGHQLVQDFFSCMGKRCMPYVVGQCNGFYQILIQPERLADGFGNLIYLQCVGQPRPVMISRRRNVYLRFLTQATKCFGMDNTIPVPHKARAQPIKLLRPTAPLAVR